jgi:hypothetical protein
VADAVQNGEEIGDRGKAEQALAKLAALEHFGFQLDGTGGRRKGETLANADFLSRLDQGAP